MSKKDKTSEQNLFVLVFDFKDSAESVYNNLHDMEKAGKVKVKTATTVYRNKHGKLKVHHKHGLTKWKGAGAGVALGFLLGGPVLGGAIGLIAGGRGQGEQRKVKHFLDEKLDENNSAIIVLIEEADWAAVENLFARFDAEIMQMELTAEAEGELAAMAANDAFAKALHAEIDVHSSDEPVAEDEEETDAETPAEEPAADAAPEEDDAA